MEYNTVELENANHDGLLRFVRIGHNEKMRGKLKGYLSVREAARNCGISVRWGKRYIPEGRIPGTERFGRTRVISDDVVKPGRSTPGVK